MPSTSRTPNISRRSLQVLFAVVMLGNILVPCTSAQANSDVTVHLIVKGPDGRPRVPSANAPVVVWLSPVGADGQTNITAANALYQVTCLAGTNTATGNTTAEVYLMLSWPPQVKPTAAQGRYELFTEIPFR